MGEAGLEPGERLSRRAESTGPLNHELFEIRECGFELGGPIWIGEHIGPGDGDEEGVVPGQGGVADGDDAVGGEAENGGKDRL